MQRQSSELERRSLARRSRSLRWSQRVLETFNSDSEDEVEVEESDLDAGQLSKILSTIATFGVQVTSKL